MSQGTNSGLHLNSTDAPFEWLTNFRSIRHLLLPSRIVGECLSSSLTNSEDVLDPNNGHVHTSSSSPEETTLQLNALHVGCGTSTVGESLMCLRERTQNHLLHYGYVVNVDNDRNALASMERRYESRKANLDEKMCTMEWKYIDFKSDESCRRAMDNVYCKLMSRSTPLNPGGCFDLVLDKSTLDCLLCAETSVVAQFLREVYRSLRVPSSRRSHENASKKIQSAATTQASWGGVYVLITFHPAEFIEKLLTQLPGADWQIEHEVVQREMEDVFNKHDDLYVDEVKHDKDNWNIGTKEQNESSSAWSSGTFNPDENYRKTVNVFTCRRCSKSDESSSGSKCILDPIEVLRHIERTCDEWYKATNPMVTHEREEQIRMAFLEATEGKSSLHNMEGSLGLKQSYDILFTNTEKEILTFDLFLDDWHAYCEGADKILNTKQDGMTVEVALDFLREMQ